jgi:putative hemolysin
MTIQSAIPKIILLVIFLSFSALFAAVEAALFSLDSIKLKRLAQGGKNTALIAKLLENPLRCLTTILAGNTLVNIAISAMVTSFLIDWLGHGTVGLSIAVTTLLILAFGEITPKTIAIYNNEKVARLFSSPLYAFNRIISPFLFLAARTCDAIISFFHLNLNKEPTLTEEEFRTVIEVGHRHGVVGKSEKEMVVSILELTTTTASEAMTPRTDIKALSIQWEQTRALAFARQARHSKLPVYKDSFDNILGIVYARDLFLAGQDPFGTLIKPVLFVPATKRIDALIKDFYRQETPIAIVVDEYGGTSGLVTLEDILQRIFGEIHDEFKVKEELVEALASGGYRISGKASLEKVNQECGLHIAPGDYETIAGFLLDVFGKIPVEGEHIAAADAVFTIEKVTGRRIKSILLEKR